MTEENIGRRVAKHVPLRDMKGNPPDSRERERRFVISLVEAINRGYANALRDLS